MARIRSCLICEPGRIFNFVAQPTRSASGGRAVMIHAVEVTEAAIAHQRTEELARELAKEGRSKDEFLAMLGHELRNPLAPILMALNLIQSRAPGDERARLVIERQVNHLARLVDDLLDVSRATMGKIDLRREPLEVATAVARAVEVAAPLIERKGHLLTVKVPGAGLLVMGDPVRLAQAIGNLLTNAAKYTNAGGHIEVEAERLGDEVVIRVRDDGIGIAPGRIVPMFELFVQGDPSVDRAQGGLGIGLTLVRSLVQLHGGFVEARSEGLGHGSEFTLRLPVLKEEALPVHVQAPEAEAPIAPRRVLVVDDNRDAAQMLAEALRHEGHEVREAFDGLEALVAAAQFRPELLFLDLGLPGMDGFEIARRLRADAQFSELKIVALTGYGQEQDRRRTAEVGIDRHLLKPISLRDILEVMRAP